MRDDDLKATKTVWHNMLARCRDRKSSSYRYYGGRGIKVCERWDSFDNFVADLGVRPSLWHSLERINVNGNYEPSNCKLIPKTDQARNRRNSKPRSDYWERIKRIREWQKRRSVREADVPWRWDDRR